MSEINRFTRTDWYAWAGAEKFKNGTDPLIYTQSLNDGKVELTMIGDRYGVDIYLTADEFNTDESEQYYWTIDEPMQSVRAEGIMRAVSEKLKKYTYAPDLTYALDHDSEPEFEPFKFVG